MVEEDYNKCLDACKDYKDQSNRKCQFISMNKPLCLLYETCYVAKCPPKGLYIETNIKGKCHIIIQFIQMH